MKIKKILTKEFVRENTVVPKWYGVAYQDFMTNTLVCYRIPLNLFVIAWRRLRWTWRELVKFAGLRGKWNWELNAHDTLLLLADRVKLRGLPEGEVDDACEVMRKIARRCLP